MRVRVRPVVSLLCVVAFALSNRAVAAVKVTFQKTVVVSYLSPATVPLSGDVTLIAFGKRLDKVGSCDMAPAVLQAGNDGKIPQVPTITCTTVPNAFGTQLMVTLKSADRPAGSYLIELKDKSGKLLTSVPLQVAAVNASSRPSNAGSPSGAQGGGGGTPPYGNCLTDLTTDGDPGSITIPSTQVLCASSVLPDGEVSDEFGYHVSTRFSAIQVRVSNKNTQFDYLLRDVVLTLPDGRIVSGRIRRFAQGVAVKGRTLDKRSAWFNSLTAMGGVYGALASFGSVGFTTAGNVFQGAFLGGFNQIYPDYTADNVNRFNNAVFDDQNPSIVPKDSIGQAPLYVIALVPKEPGLDKDSAYQVAKRTRVAIEGTFIKQVTLLNLSAQKIDYKPQFISPTAVFKPSTFNFDALRSLSEEQTFIVSNPGSTIINIHGFKIVQGDGTANSVSASNDFEVDSDANKSTCGITGSTTTPSTGDRGFTIAPNASCVIAIKFHPTMPGAITATLKFDGDNFEGSSSVALTGKGIGLILQVNDQASPAVSHTLGCTYADASGCVMNLGSQTSGTVDVNVFYYTGNTTDKVTFTAGTATTDVTSVGMLPSVSPTLPSSKTLPVAVATTGSTAMTLTDTPTTNFSTPFAIKFTYQTIPSTLTWTGTIDGSTHLVTSPLSVKMTSSSGTPTGQVAFTFTNVNTGVASAPQSQTVDANGLATPDLSKLTPGTYSISAAFTPSSNALYRVSGPNQAMNTVLIPAAGTVKVGSMPVGTVHSVAATVTVAVTGSGICKGIVTPSVTAPGGAVVTVAPSTATLDATGAASFSFTPQAVGSYLISMSYAADATSTCAGSSGTATWTVP